MLPILPIQQWSSKYHHSLHTFCRYSSSLPLILQLDYYLIRGDGTLPSILTSYASLLSPTSPSFPAHPISASPTLPPLSQFGYLASSLSMAADANAQEAIIEFLRTSREEGFAVDGLYLSSGWCQGESQVSIF